ncbi:MAG: hypothetical protein KC432_09585 [Thermomicrobiales bacterium]|nr:hypothetical protein [Thermomicrobiales bacterium]
MALICNTVEMHVHPEGGDYATTEWTKLYLSNEHRIESGSAFFAHAFAEALGIVSALELRDPDSAELKLDSIVFLLDRALEQYAAAAEFEAWTGLNAYHERRLREAGLGFAGVSRVLEEAAKRNLLSVGAQRIEAVAHTFEADGYAGLTDQYLELVRAIRAVALEASASGITPKTAVAWQELGWKLTALFSSALEIGQAMAILNTFTFRLEAETGALA